MSLYPALWGRVMDSIPPADQQPRGLPYPLPTEDPQFVLGRSNPPHSHPQQHWLNLYGSQKTSALARARHMHAWTPPAPPSPLQSTNGRKALSWKAKAAFKVQHQGPPSERTFPSRSSNIWHSTGQPGRSPVPLEFLKYTKSTKIDDPRDASRDTSGHSPWYLFSLAPSVEECAAQGPDSTPTWSGTSSNVAEPYTLPVLPDWAGCSGLNISYTIKNLRVTQISQCGLNE